MIIESNISTDKNILGIQFFIRLIEIIDKISIKLQIWDISGDGRFEALRLKYYSEYTRNNSNIYNRRSKFNQYF
ncbi:MAG: hypothetical protein ACP6IY_19210 [Promethearchaeia archaeon]